MKQLIGLILLLPLLASAQSENKPDIKSEDVGIRFEHSLTWQEVLTKAKTENKHIFIDFYTTWCAPCKWMERDVYPRERVGNYFNEHFISVKVQMDKTSRDNELVKAWYADAKQMEKDYSINAYPTYLFLSPAGRPVHRKAGAFDEEQFIKMGENALDPQKQSYTLSAKYVAEKMDTGQLKKIANDLKFDNPELGQKLVEEYIRRVGVKNIKSKEELDLLVQYKSDSAITKYAEDYINGLSGMQAYNKDNISFMVEFINDFGTARKPFKFFYAHPGRIDSVMNAGDPPRFFAKKFVDGVIAAEYVKPKITAAKNTSRDPDWNVIGATVSKKFGAEYADRVVINAKRTWYRNQKNWKEYTSHIVQYMEKYGSRMENDFGWNNNAWEVFTYSDDPKVLTKALEWSGRAVLANPYPNWMDTYANILYKLGKKQSAIYWESQASKLSPSDKSFESTLSKMKQGLPTWSKP